MDLEKEINFKVIKKNRSLKFSTILLRILELEVEE